MPPANWIGARRQILVKSQTLAKSPQPTTF